METLELPEHRMYTKMGVPKHPHQLAIDNDYRMKSVERPIFRAAAPEDLTLI
jgi:hypothetical protein